MENNNPICQSCGMPLSQDPNKGGSNADGSASTKYCSYCYSDGKFTQPDITATDMQQQVKHMLQQQGIPAQQADAMTSEIPTLGRWTNA